MEEKRILSYEEIMTLMAENAKGFAELKALQAKNEEENAKGFAEIREQQRENAKGFAELRKLQKAQSEDADKRLLKLEELVGNIGKNTGHYAEEFFQRSLGKTLMFAGIKFDKLIPNLKIEKKENCEFDIVMINGNSVAIIEVKNRIHPDFIEEMATVKLAQFRKFFNEYKDYKVYLGVAGLSFDDYVVKKAKEYGIAVLRQDGNTIVVNDDIMKVY